jgi:hypothetical protein
MRTVRAILTEIFGLFIDDGALALMLVGWCAVLAVVAALVPALLPVAGPVLCLGCVLILVGNVVRTVRLR